MIHMSVVSSANYNNHMVDWIHYHNVVEGEHCHNSTRARFSYSGRAISYSGRAV